MRNPKLTRCRWLLGARMLALAIVMVAAAACEASPPPEKPPPDPVLAGSAQEQWLRADLAAHPARCTLAYWHHPLFTSGGNGNSDFMRPIWQALYEAGADVVLNGHDHDYERFAPQDPGGAPDPARGIREIVAGTGGGDLTWRWESNQPNSEVRNKDTHGVIKLTLHAGSYDWEFIPIAGETFTDSGSGSCHGATSPKRG